MDFIKALQTSKAVKVHRGATESDIGQMLKIIRVRLPNDYRRFLLECGWAQIGPNTIYGLGPDVSNAESVHENSVTEGVFASPPMPSRLVPLMNDGSGNHYCLDTERIKGDHCPIVFWDHEDPMGELQKPKKVSNSFEEWIIEVMSAENDIS